MKLKINISKINNANIANPIIAKPAVTENVLAFFALKAVDTVVAKFLILPKFGERYIQFFNWLIHL